MNCSSEIVELQYEFSRNPLDSVIRKGKDLGELKKALLAVRVTIPDTSVMIYTVVNSKECVWHIK